MIGLHILKSSLLLTLGVSLAFAQTDYCTSSLCGNSQHIACQNTGAWLAACPKSPAPTAVVMTSALQTEIVKGHNSRRQTLAAGALPGFSSAVRMAPVRWNAELARLAALNVRQCQMKHDACRNTPTFRASGQNLAMVGYSGAISSRSDQALVTQSLTMWWDEYKITTKAQINSYPQNYNGPAIGHFTAMAQEKQTHVGCAAARYLKTSMNYWLFACNYATTNYVNQPVYAAGPTASKCKTGTHVNFPALCKVAEVYT